MEQLKISIKEDFIRLDSALKLASVVQTGGHAKIVIQNGEVRVNGDICTQRGKKIRLNDIIHFDGKEIVLENAGK